MKYHYIYKVTRDDGKYYIGMHSTDDINDGYFGSGKLIIRSIEKHGKDKHIKEILEVFQNSKTLQKREEEIVNEKLLEDPFCMNIVTGGKGWSSEDVSKMIKKNWQDPVYRAKMSEINSKAMKEFWKNSKNKEQRKLAYKTGNGNLISKAKRTKIMKERWQDPVYRAKMSESNKERWQDPVYRAKMSNKGTIWIKHPELKSKRIMKDEPIPAGWGKGRRMK